MFQGCLDKLNSWFHEHSTLFLITGLSLIVVQLSVLVSSIFLCMKRAKVGPQREQHEYPDTPQPRVDAVRSDEIYPIKSSPINLPLALIDQKNYRPKVYNTEQRMVNNFVRNGRLDDHVT